jgi:hypothetical protein
VSGEHLPQAHEGADDFHIDQDSPLAAQTLILRKRELVMVVTATLPSGYPREAVVFFTNWLAGDFPTCCVG